MIAAMVRDAITEGVATRADIAGRETKIDTAPRFPRGQGPVAGAGLEPATQGL